MCEFCVQHGDGQTWYLEAANYAADLSRDLERREYMIDFVRGFDTRMRRNVKLLDALSVAPRPVRAAFHSIAGKRQMQDHFGQPVPLEECARIFDFATSIVQLPCVCRHLAGKPAQGYCLAVTVTPIDDVLSEAFADYLQGPDVSALQHLSRTEALGVLERAEREGLMHSVWTFKTPFIAAICNCDLASGCMAMKTTLEWGHRTMWHGEYVAVVDETACSGCGACIERCPFSAAALDTRGVAVIDPLACFGCGICRSACPVDAIALEDRAAEGVPSAGDHRVF
ncbi:MAG: 4Fe-4S binding protein [Coriobacteriia bacterium]|nr:4Fe-4S binding protein [Coriobacteriia bacterium]